MIGTQFELESEVADNANLMCEFTVEVTHYFHQPPHRGSKYTCDSSDDYYGYTEVEWDYVDWIVIDQDGGEVACGMGDPKYNIAMSDRQIQDYIEDALEYMRVADNDY